MSLFYFEVSGSGNFPVELLSHGVWPSSDEDSKNLINFSSKRTINLISIYRPTQNTWRSYGWDCFFNEDVIDDYNEYHTWPC